MVGLTFFRRNVVIAWARILCVATFIGIACLNVLASPRADKVLKDENSRSSIKNGAALNWKPDKGALLEPAPNIQSLNGLTSMTTVQVHVTISSTSPSPEAMVSCAASLEPYSRFPTSAEIELQRNWAFTVNHVAAINIGGLVPATTYKVYCTVKTLEGVDSTSEDIAANAFYFTTLCCKQIQLEILRTTSTVGTVVPLAFSIRLLHAPSSSVILKFITNPASDLVYPSQLSFTANSVLNTANYAALIPSTEGTFTLVPELIGPAAAEYEVVFLPANANHITVLGSLTPPAAPVLVSAVFANDGSYVILNFDTATDQGGFANVFPCNSLLLFGDVETAQCNWADASTIRIYSKVLNVFDAVLLQPGVLRAQCPTTQTSSCATWDTTSATAVIVLAPAAPVTPLVVLTMPTRIGACDALVVDLSASSGAGGRPWSNVIFAVLSTTTDSSGAARLQQYLNANFTISPPIVVPRGIFPKGQSYTISVLMCNFLGACMQTARSVEVSNSEEPVPSVTILGPTTRTTTRSAVLVLNANAYLQYCSGVRSSANLVYTWAVTELPSGQAAEIKSVSQNPSVFKIAPYVLAVESYYQIALTVSSPVTTISSAATVSVTVLPGALVAVVGGGSTQTALVGDILYLDASQSYDQDQSDVTGTAVGLQFSWTCVQSAPQFSTTCPLVADPASMTSELLQVTVPPAALNTTSTWTVLVTDNLRSASAATTVAVTEAPVPKVVIRNRADSLTNVNTGKQTVLQATVQLWTPCTAVWSTDDASLSLVAAAKSAVAVQLLPDAAGTPVPFNLILREGALPQRAALVFTLTCGGGSAAVPMTTNGAPQSGIFLTNPSVGNELSTVFTLLAQEWADPDLPLTYLFGFVSAASLANLVIVSKSERSYATTTLPAGPQSDSLGTDFPVTLQLQVFDGLQASTTVKTAVQVRPATSVTEKNAALLQILSAGDESVDATKNALSVVSTALNIANCTSAPVCADLYREPCQKTNGYCSGCREGYTGDASDRNTPCMPLGTDLSAAASACSHDADCSNWQHCDFNAGVCAVNSKSCGQNCTGNGFCIFIDVVTGALLPTCLLYETRCEAVCSCDVGYSGEFCEIDAYTLQSTRQVRSVLISSLGNLTALEDVNEETVSAWSASLYSLSLRPHDLSQSDVTKVAAIANTTLSSAISLGVKDIDDMRGVLQATDAVASLLRYNYNPNDYRDENFPTPRGFVNNSAAAILPVLSAFADLVSSAKVLGENDTTLLYENFRLKVGISRISSAASNVTVAAPTSSSEQVSSPASSLTLVGDVNAAASTVAVKLVSVFPRAYALDTASLVSTPMVLQLQSQDTAEPATEFISALMFTLQHNEVQIEYIHAPPVNFTTICPGRNATVRYKFTCPQSNVVLEHNCTRGAGTQVTYCPRPTPACAQVDIATANLAVVSACTVVNYTATHTVCSCSLRSPLPQRAMRRQLDGTGTAQEVLDESGSTTMVSTSVYIASEFADTFTVAEDFTSPADAESVLTVIILLAVLWVPALSLLAYSFIAERRRGKTNKVAAAAAVSPPVPPSPKDAILAYVRTIIPRIYAENTSLRQQIWNELSGHHSLFLLTSSERGKQQRNTVCKLLTMFTFMLFLTAVFFDVSNPGDDGTCSAHTTDVSCLHRASPFDNSQTFCIWVTPPEGQTTPAPYCRYNRDAMTLKALFYLTVFTTIITSVSTVPLDYCLSILSAPTVQSLQGTQLGRATATVGLLLAGARRLTTAGVSALNRARRARSTVGASSSTNVSSAHKSDKSKQQLWYSRLVKSFTSLLPSTETAVIANREMSEEMAARSVEARQATSAVASYTLALTLQEQTYVLQMRRLAAKEMTRRCSMRDWTDDVEEAGGFQKLSVQIKKIKKLVAPKHEIIADIIQQRLLISDNTFLASEFSKQWDICVKGVKAHPVLFYVDKDTRRILINHANRTTAEANAISARLPQFTREHAGLEILQLFIVDLLGKDTAAAKIFQEKFSEDFAETRAVYLWQKQLAAGILVGLNAFFLYFILLKGFQKGREWQWQYVVCSLIQIAVDVLLFETTECLWLNFNLPRSVQHQIEVTVAKLTALIEEVTTRKDDKPPELPCKNGLFFNAAPHLFVSVKVANSQPLLLESQIVRSYRQHVPGPWRQTWQQLQAQHERAKRHPLVWLFLFLVLYPDANPISWAFVKLLEGGTTVPYGYQRIILRIAQPVIFAGIPLVWYAVAESILAKLFVAYLMILVMCYVIFKHSVDKKRALEQQEEQERADRIIDLLTEERPPNFIFDTVTRQRNIFPTADVIGSTLNRSSSSDSSKGSLYDSTCAVPLKEGAGANAESVNAAAAATELMDGYDSVSSPSSISDDEQAPMSVPKLTQPPTQEEHLLDDEGSSYVTVSSESSDDSAGLYPEISPQSTASLLPRSPAAHAQWVGSYKKLPEVDKWSRASSDSDIGSGSDESSVSSHSSWLAGYQGLGTEEVVPHLLEGNAAYRESVAAANRNGESSSNRSSDSESDTSDSDGVKSVHSGDSRANMLTMEEGRSPDYV